MSDEDKTERDDVNGEQPAKTGRWRGFHLELGLGPLSDLLSSLIEVNISELPPPENVPDWTSGAKQNGEQGRSEVDQRRRRIDRRHESVSKQCRIDTRTSDDVFFIIADLPGTTEGDLSVGISNRTNEFVIKKVETIVGRVKLPWESAEVTHARFNNGILEIQIQPSET